MLVKEIKKNNLSLNLLVLFMYKINNKENKWIYVCALENEFLGYFFNEDEFKIIDSRFSKYWTKSKDGLFLGFPDILKYRYDYILGMDNEFFIEGFDFNENLKERYDKMILEFRNDNFEYTFNLLGVDDWGTCSNCGNPMEEINKLDEVQYCDNCNNYLNKKVPE